LSVADLDRPLPENETLEDDLIVTLLNVYDRQERIAHWNQQNLREARVAVVGRDFLGASLTWGLGSLGVGEILWVGRRRPETEALARFLLSDPPPWGEAKVYDLPFDVEYGSELDWSVGEPLPQLVAIVTENPREQQQTLDWAQRRGVPALVGSTADTGWFGASLPPEPRDAPQNPVLAMVEAPLLLDASRELICPLPAGMLPPEGPLGLRQPLDAEQDVNVLQIGVGGIGAYFAAALAAALGPKLNLRLWDFDRVDPTNLNRQGLFTVDDARQRTPKAHAAMRSLSRVFPRAWITSEIRCLGPDDAPRVAELSPRPNVLLSAVDNAASRLILQHIGQELSIPVIQGGTSVFAADCYTQDVGGPLLDDQMHGALREAAEREKLESVGHRHRGGCAAHASYIVPVMIAGAMAAYRVTQLGRHPVLPPLRWRSGGIPLESRSSFHVQYDLDEISV
jgi:molybdopterin/thiamine biosynthesis adenylyltransferase